MPTNASSYMVITYWFYFVGAGTWAMEPPTYLDQMKYQAEGKNCYIPI